MWHPSLELSENHTHWSSLMLKPCRTSMTLVPDNYFQKEGGKKSQLHLHFTAIFVRHSRSWEGGNGGTCSTSRQNSKKNQIKPCDQSWLPLLSRTFCSQWGFVPVMQSPYRSRAVHTYTLQILRILIKDLNFVQNTEWSMHKIVSCNTKGWSVLKIKFI